MPESLPPEPGTAIHRLSLYRPAVEMDRLRPLQAEIIEALGRSAPVIVETPQALINTHADFNRLKNAAGAPIRVPAHGLDEYFQQVLPADMAARYTQPLDVQWDGKVFIGNGISIGIKNPDDYQIRRDRYTIQRALIELGGVAITTNLDDIFHNRYVLNYALPLITNTTQLHSDMKAACANLATFFRQRQLDQLIFSLGPVSYDIVLSRP